jgi:hypothetical protein
LPCPDAAIVALARTPLPDRDDQRASAAPPQTAAGRRRCRTRASSRRGRCAAPGVRPDRCRGRPWARGRFGVPRRGAASASRTCRRRPACRTALQGTLYERRRSVTVAFSRRDHACHLSGRRREPSHGRLVEHERPARGHGPPPVLFPARLVPLSGGRPSRLCVPRVCQLSPTGPNSATHSATTMARNSLHNGPQQHSVSPSSTPQKTVWEVS